MLVSSKRFWPSYAAGGALLGLATTAERILHHSLLYGRMSAALLHTCLAVLAAGGLGAVAGLALDGADAVIGRSAKRRTQAACAIAAIAGVAAYWGVVRVSKYRNVLPAALGVALFAAAAALVAYGAARLLPFAVAQRKYARWLGLLGVATITWIDLHAFVRSYGNVHVVLSVVALLGAGGTTALFAPRPELLRRALATASALALAGALLTPTSHTAKNAALQFGALEKLLIQHVLWPALDGDGDGAARAPLGVDCDDADASNAPLRLPLRAPSLGCAPVMPVATGAPAPPPVLTPRRDLVFIVVDTWRTDTPRELPSWTNAFTRFSSYRSCGARTEQVLSQLLGNDGCPKAIAGGSVVTFLRSAGYEIVHMGQYNDATGQIPNATKQKSRDEALDHATAFFTERSASKPLFAVVHFKGGHSGYDGSGDSLRARYDDAIERTLEAVGQLVQALPRDAIVVVAGDHGEEFGEHYGAYHASSLYEEVLRTRVLVRAPTLRPGRDPRALECVSLAEMIAALVSDAPPPERAPESFALMASPKGVHGGLTESLSFATVRPDGLKLIWQPQLDLFELYDLERDPGEKRNLADDQPDELRAMAGYLLERVQACAGPQRFTE